MPNAEELLESLILELRRGTLTLSVLSQLHAPMYGYQLVQTLEEKGVEIDAGTLYPLLRRLEKQGILQSEWETSGTKPRKYYLQTALGLQVYERLCAQWRAMDNVMEQLMSHDH